MRYQGGKHRLSKRIVEHIERLRQPGQFYVEPFVGGASVFSKVPSDEWLVFGGKIGSDICPHIITLMKAVQDGWNPPSEVSDEVYQDVKGWSAEERTGHPLYGFVGYGHSYGGKFFGGYAKPSKKNTLEQPRMGILARRKGLIGSLLIECDYSKCIIPEKSIIYCDPPYKGTSGYKGRENFDHDAFWAWAVERNRNGHTVLVSETECPVDHEVLFEVRRKTGIRTRDREKKMRDALFLIGG